MGGGADVAQGCLPGRTARHARGKDFALGAGFKMSFLSESDPQIFAAMERELDRQKFSLELIPSENTTSRAVMEAQGSVLTNKYAEGLPGKRYYGGCEFVDQAERLANER